MRLICIVAVLLLNVAESQSTVCSYMKTVSYTYSCGFWGWQQCVSYGHVTSYRCCSGWDGTVATGCTTPICSWSCPSGGRCTSPNYCSNCNRGYYSPRCHKCASIAHCLAVHCTSSSNQVCDSCDGDYGVLLGSAYIRSSSGTRCIKRCSWRSDSNACYPGSCTTGTQCTCTSGFYGTDCRTMSASQSPVISAQRASLIKENMTLETITAVGRSGETVYTNVTDFTSIRLTWTTWYQPDGLPEITTAGHPYIHSVHMGVVSARAIASVQMVGGGSYWIGDQSCVSTGIPPPDPDIHYPVNPGNLSRSSTGLNPVSGNVTCNITFTIKTSDWTPATGDVLICYMYSTSGGYLRLYDRDHGHTNTRSYTGRTMSTSLSFTFSLDGPYHCVGTTECRTSMLNVGSHVITKPTLTVTWQGWSDDHAGIKQYNLQVLQLSGTSGDEMTEELDSPAVYDGVSSSGHVIILPHVGVYSVVLSVVDNIGNVRRSRRIVFFDDDYDDVSVQRDNPMRVVSASAETDYTWLTDTPDQAGGSIAVLLSWQDHFINADHANQGLLKPIGPYTYGIIDIDYDQIFGRRALAAVPNALGLTEFRVFYDIDHISGGRAIVNVTNDNSSEWHNEATNTQATHDLTLVDGDSIRFWVEARDIAGHFGRDSVLIHVDSSPPVIEDIRMSVGLYNTSFELRTFDKHSGIKTIEWRVIDNATEALEFGTETVHTTKDTGMCDPTTCVCTPIGHCYPVVYYIKPVIPTEYHSRDFVVVVMVTNNAGLMTKETIKTMVTPQNVGQVAESLVSITNDTSSIDGKAVVHTADMLEGIVNTRDTSPEVTTNVVNVVNNLLQVNSEELVAESCSRIVKSLDMQISNVLASGRNITAITSNLAVTGMSFLPSSLVNGVGFANIVGENGTQTNMYMSVTDIPVEQVTASVGLPAQIVNKSSSEGAPIAISFIIYQNSKLFRSQLTISESTSYSSSVINSRVIAATVEEAHITDLPADTPVVTAFLQDQRQNDNVDDEKSVECVFWDFSLRDGIGEWSTEGCRLSSLVHGRTICHCSHTSNFAVLENYKVPEYTLDVFNKIGFAVSIVALVITITVYTTMRSLRALEASRILISFCCSLLLLNIVFVAGIHQTSSRSGCIMSAILLHYFAVTSIAWIGVEAASLYLHLVNSNVKHFMIKTSIATWGFPVLVVIIALAADYTVYDNDDSCFLKPGAAFYAGQLPIVCLIFLFNTIIFVMVVRKLAHQIEGTLSEDGKRIVIMKRLKSMVSLTILFTLAWSFCLMSVFHPTNLTFRVLLCVSNALLATCVFCLFVVQQNEVREYFILLRRRAGLMSGYKTGEAAVSFKRSAAKCSDKSDRYQCYENMDDGPYESYSGSTSAPVYEEIAVGGND